IKAEVDIGVPLALLVLNDTIADAKELHCNNSDVGEKPGAVLFAPGDDPPRIEDVIIHQASPTSVTGSFFSVLYARPLPGPLPRGTPFVRENDNSEWSLVGVHFWEEDMENKGRTPIISPAFFSVRNLCPEIGRLMLPDPEPPSTTTADRQTPPDPV